MKLKYIISTLFAIGIFACYNDEGNYDYQEINEISVRDSLKEEYSVYMLADTLKISPVLNFTQDSTTAGRFEFSWYLTSLEYEEGKITKISDQLNLVYPVTAKEGSYKLSLGIKDLKTGVEWLTHSTLNVTTLFTNGWLMLGEKEGNVALDMVTISTKGDTIITRDILKNSGLPVLKGPRKMVSTAREGYNPWYAGCFLMTDEGTFELDRKSLSSDISTNIRSVIYDPTINDDFSASDLFQNGTYHRYLLGDNKIFVNQSLIQSNSYGNCINKYTQYSEEYFNVYPEAIWQFNPMYVQGKQLVYDMDNKRFAQFTYMSSYCDTLPDNTGDPFEWKTGNEMIAINNSLRIVEGAQVSYAVMKSPENKYYLYSMLPALAKKLERYDISTLPGIAQAKQFGFSSKYPRMIYATGSKLYACEFLPSGITHKELEDFGNEITMIHFDNAKESKKDFFYVATYNETDGGTIQKYQLTDNPNDMKTEKFERSRWEKLCKVTSMCWKWN